MTLAVLCESTGSDLALTESLEGALRSAGAGRVIRVAGPDVSRQVRQVAEIAAGTDEALLLCSGDLVAHPSLLWTLATEPAGRSNALVEATGSGAGGDLREDRGRLVPAGDGPTRFLGALYVSTTDLGLIAAAAPAAEKAAEKTAAEKAAEKDAAENGPAGAVDLLFQGLLGNGLVPLATRVRLLKARRVHTPAERAEAQREVDGVDEDRALLRLAVKEKDDFFTTYAVSSWSPWVTKLCARAGLSPSAVTGLSVLLAVVAALAFWQASRPAMIVGGVLLYLGFVLDCVDGQLARYTRTFSAFGGWLDTMADRAKEYAVYAGLAAGADRLGLSFAWPLAIAAIVLQTVRHMTDTWYGALHDEAAKRQAVGTAGNADPATSVGARLSRASNKVQADTGSFMYWAKRIVVFPIGERWALLSVAAACFDGRVALALLLGFGVLAFAYTLGLRSLRSVSMRVGVLNTVDASRHRDDGRMVRGTLSALGGQGALLWSALAAAVMLLLVGGVAAGIVPRGTTWALGELRLTRAGDAAAWLVPALIVALFGAGSTGRARHDQPLDWLVPAALRALEYLTVVLVGMVCKVPPPVIFLLLFVLALRHYDLTARMEKAAPEDPHGRRALLGWDGRVFLLVFFALAGAATFGELLLAVGLGVQFAANALRDWRAGGRR